MNDLIRSGAIIVVFVVLTMNIVMLIGAKNIQDNWPVYRCNPLLMPMAASFAPEGSTVTTEENFAYCIQNTMTSFAPVITQPFNYIQQSTVDMLGSINTSNENTMGDQSTLKMNLSTITEDLYGVIAGLMIQFSILTVKITDSQHKLMGVMSTVMYIITSVQYTFMSMWDGIPGSLIKSFSKIKV
jgi:hypothetical protein